MARSRRPHPTSAQCQSAIARLLAQGHLDEARRHVKAHLRLAPADPWLLNEAGRLSRRAGDLAEAERCYRRLLAQNPCDAGALNGLGLTRYDGDDLVAAEQLYRQALQHVPAYSACHNNLAVLLHRCDRHQEAIAAYRAALQHDPHYHAARYGLATVLAHAGELAAAEACVRTYLQAYPHDTRAQTTLGMVLLQQGRFGEGWPLYRARYAADNPQRFVTLPDWPVPYWQGQSLQGRTLLVLCEQGFGDALQFARYLCRIKDEHGAARVLLVCREPLRTLLATLANVDAVLATAPRDALPPFDAWCMLLDVPAHFVESATPFAPCPPYLRVPEPVSTLLRLPEDRHRPGAKRMRVGLVWRGAAAHLNDRHRSLHGLDDLAPLLGRADIQWVSLQKGAGEDDARTAARQGKLLALGHTLHGFADTAAVVAQLDLVITVDTAVAHLAGAMDVPCWVMLPALARDWRWLEGQTRSPWYPRMQLFPRGATESWREVVARMARQLPASAAPSSTAQ